MAYGRHRHVAERSFGDRLQELHRHTNAHLGGQLKVLSLGTRLNRKRLSEGLGVVSVAERCHDDEPFSSGDVGGKAAVLVRADVEPLVVGFVVQQEVVGNAFVGAVVQGSRDQVGVLQSNFVRFIDCIEADADGVKEGLTDQVVIRGVLIRGCRLIEQQIVAARRQRDGNDARLGVVFCGEVNRVAIFSDRLQREVRCGHRAVLKRTVFGSVQEDVHFNLDGFRVGKQLHRGEGFRVGAIDVQVINRRGVQSLIGKGNRPDAGGKVEGKVAQFVGGGGPHQAGVVGRHHFGCLPEREGRVPAGGVVVEMDDAVDATGRFNVQGAQVDVDARFNGHQRTVATAGDNALGRHVVSET